MAKRDLSMKALAEVLAASRGLGTLSSQCVQIAYFTAEPQAVKVKGRWRAGSVGSKQRSELTIDLS
jgi:hypothetical protein